MIIRLCLLFSLYLSRVTEQPYKIPYYAALLRLLHDPQIKAETTESSSLGKQILEDFWKGFQAFLDKLAWREARLCVSIDCLHLCQMLFTPRTGTFLCASHNCQSHFARVLDLASTIIHHRSRWVWCVIWSSEKGCTMCCRGSHDCQYLYSWRVLNQFSQCNKREALFWNWLQLQMWQKS